MFGFIGGRWKVNFCLDLLDFGGGGVLFCVVECVVSFVDWEMGI